MRVLITGANRGLGLELTRQLLARGDEVVATCRDPSSATALQGLATEHAPQARILALDVRDDESVQAALDAVEAPLDVLVNNAGINHRDTFDTVTAAMLLEALDVNAVGALRLILAAQPLLEAGAKVVNVSSQLGSLERQGPGFGSLAYNTSKAAMNMITRQVAVSLPEVIVISVHPGWVRTDMGGPRAAIDVITSARGVIRVADQATAADSGGFFTYEGSPHPW